MTTKRIFPKIQIHPFFYIVMGIALMTGNIRSFLIFMSILIFHELGHIIAGMYYGWKIDHILLLPFGALTLFQDHLNKPMKEEWWIVIMGPLFQCIYALIAHILAFDSPLFLNFHYGLLMFNLSPILPLDGSKCVRLLCQRYCSFWSSLFWSIGFSILFLVLLLFWFQDQSLLFLLVTLLFLQKLVEEYQNRHAVFSKFLLERYLYSFPFPKSKMIVGENVKQMKRDTKHLFYINQKYQTEREIIQKKFDFKRKQW